MATINQSRRADNPLHRFLSQAQLLNWELVLYIIIFALAVFTRFYALGDRVMSHDESLHTRYSYNLYNDGNFQHTPLMHGPILFHFTAFFYFLFGDNDFTARIYPALLGVLVIMFPLLLRQWLGRIGALLASFMLLISPIMMYYNRYIRHDTPAIFFSLLMVYAILMYLNGPAGLRRKTRWLVLLSVGTIGNLGSKETAFIYIAIFGLFLAMYWFVRLAQEVWRLPGRTLMYSMVIAVLVGGVAALGFYVLLAVVPASALDQAAQLDGGLLNSLDGMTFIVGTLLIALVTLGILVVPLLKAFHGGAVRVSPRLSDFVVIGLIALATCLALIYIEERSHISDASTDTTSETSEPVTPGGGGLLDQIGQGANTTPLIIAWVGGALVVTVIFVTWRMGLWRWFRRFPEFDLLIVLGSLILPWATPFIITAMGVKATDYSQAGITRAVLALIPMVAISVAAGVAWNWRRWAISTAVFYAIFVFFFTTMLTNINGLATGVIGSLGYWLEQQGVRRGSQPQYYYLGLIMPFYEFLPVLGSVLAMCSGMTLFWRLRRDRLAERQVQAELDALQLEMLAEGTDEEDVPSLSEVTGETPPAHKRVIAAAEWLDRLPFLLFVSWWAIFNLIGYTLAGEKMPWLATHLTLPLIFLTGWFFGQVFGRIDWQRFRQGGWLAVLLFPILFVTLFQVVWPFFTGGPVAGLQQVQLARSGTWLAALLVSGVLIYGLMQLWRRYGAAHLRQMFAVAVFSFLSLLTARSALMASFVNYDYATEYLVYAHAAPAVKTVLAELEELSRLTTDGMALSFAYDNETSWPYSWYFRDFTNAQFFGSSPSRPIIDQSMAVVVGEANRAAVEPLLEDRFYHFEYIRLWWPMQDYFNLTAQRLSGLFDFSAENAQAAQLRQGLFDIWWSRDYTTYGQAVNRNFDVTQWPVSDRMHFYVRKDVAAQIWTMSVGDGSVSNPLDQMEENVCNANWQALSADMVIGSVGNGQGQLNRPLGLSVAADGTLYIAEESNNRISVFNADGTFRTILGQTDAGSILARPNAVAVAPDGNLVIADTWNYQVRVMNANGQVINQWGERGEYGANAQADPVYGLWGPRDVVVDSTGRIYISDTGNKRIRVYTADGRYLRDIGSGGSNPGQLDEPSGLALHDDGRLFVADYWNRRISVFNVEGGTFEYTFPVRAWYDEQGNRPYVAVDSVRDMVYVSDPDAGRILVYDTTGNCLGSFGQISRDNVDGSRFHTTAGLALDAQGNIYVTDAGTGRVLRFAPFPIETVPQPDDNIAGRFELEIDVTDEVLSDAEAEYPEGTDRVNPASDDESPADTAPETTAESTPEVTGEVTG